MTSALITVHNLHHTYMVDTPLAQSSLRGIHLEVYEREAVGLIGPTGSGKSTLLQHLNGLLHPQRGEVHVLGHDLRNPKTDLQEIRRSVGLVFQRPEDQVFEEYVGDDIAYGPRLMGIEKPQLRERVRWAMDLVGLDFNIYVDRLTATLSGGERRKVGLAGVLALRPRVLLLDEPTAGLDPVTRADFLNRLEKLRKEGLTLVIATHNMDDIARIAGRIYALQEGKVVLKGTTRQVFSQVETLQSLDLDVPPTVEVLWALHQRGFDLPLDALTPEEAESAILAALGKGEKTP
ncbi:MAG: ATP-binding cassette domain-containing protein [Anaerolineae bacterium]